MWWGLHLHWSTAFYSTLAHMIIISVVCIGNEVTLHHRPILRRCQELQVVVCTTSSSTQWIVAQMGTYKVVKAPSYYIRQLMTYIEFLEVGNLWSHR